VTHGPGSRELGAAGVPDEWSPVVDMEPLATTRPPRACTMTP
jgi:hypothetical protein